MSFLSKIFGDANARFLKTLDPLLARINALEPEIERFSDAELSAQTVAFKKRLAEGTPLDDLLPEAFATVREVSKRVLKMRHFDVQMLGGIVLHQGKISEMRTGEGKTLVATLPVYLNALTGKGVHIVTVNEYLAKRDAEWMGAIYRFLGLSVGVTEHGQTVEEKRAAYMADITYGTNNEFGFDYLRDNMVPEFSAMTQRELAFGIVDEVDSILIDEARTPLIISAPDSESTSLYKQFAALVPRLKENTDYNIDEKLRAVTLTDEGIGRVESMLGMGNMYTEKGIELVHHLEQALRAHTLFHRDRDYVVKNGEILIVDEFTGRLMVGRRYSEGLHQAIEAKENVEVRRESVTLATITFQNYFRLYKKLAGMTGTAVTSAEEFANVYHLEVVVIPTHRPMVRDDSQDRVYKTELGKMQAVVRDIAERNQKGQPVLVGTISIEKNERLSDMLQRAGVPHNILNAKNHEREAEIIRQAGRLGGVTVATNMAGRGVDIILGGSPPDPAEAQRVCELGGLHVLGTERHEARRIDNQLRGRSGRQGDPGSSQFFVSLEDDLMRLFGSDRVKGMMDTLKVPEDQPIEHPLISRSIETAQRKVEGNNFDIRKHVLEYDDVMNKHREVVYRKRKQILIAWEHEKQKQQGGSEQVPEDTTVKHLREQVFEKIENEIEQVVSRHTMIEKEGEWDTEEIFETVRTIFPLPGETHAKLDEMKGLRAELGEVEARTKMIEYLVEHAREAYATREQELGAFTMRQIERAVVLRTIDSLWINHLDAMLHLREGVGLRGYGQRDPLVEYKKESFEMFQRLLEGIQSGVVYTIFKVGIVSKQATPMERQDVQESSAEKGGATQQPEHTEKVGRNDPCPCGSGKKYKKCHGV